MTDSGERVQLLEAADLEEHVGRVLDAKVGRFLMGTGLAALTALVGAIASWYSTQGRIHALEREILRIDRQGTQQMPGVVKKLDSLGVELKYLPSRTADEVELRLRAQGGR